jgi:hypothetical protein
MQYLSVGINALSGQLPRELGSLTDLISLSFSSNNFSGSLPSELGNLVNLQQLYMDSCGISGPIPPSFANLQGLTQMWASDIELTGRIPDFIGNWSGLSVLRFQGTALQGPIPLSFSNLTSLTNLAISDLSNGSFSLDFISGLRSLNILNLRNNNIFGPIPANISAYRSLSQLDLSFNNLSGEIPSSLFSGSLNFLFLGNNRLTGTLPPIKNSTLTNIDLSYNELSGSFPSWITEQNLQINLIANNFSLDGSLNSSNLPPGLNCLQRNFPCGRNAPIYSEFAVKCGGQQIRSANQVLFESDNGALGPATYNVTRSSRWAVSNVGLFANQNNPSYITSSTSQITNTLDSELFQTSRISPGSLRYYGLGLENGNYTLTLQFAETQMVETRRVWQSLGRRVFDVYVQGRLVEREFDIRREAGGTSLRAVVRNYNNVRVTENYVEVHLFWAGKGTCCIPLQGTYGPSISAISASPEFTPSVTNDPPTTRRTRNRTGLIVGIVVPLVLATLVSLYFAYYFLQKKKKRQTLEDEEFFGMDTRPYTFTYAALRDATDDFNPENKLGEGGFGPVFKGTLEDGRVVAVKQLSVASHQGKSQFVAEIATISAVQHRNLVKLYGCCIESDKRLLVYEYLENKSLDQALFGTTLKNFLNYLYRNY